MLLLTVLLRLPNKPSASSKTSTESAGQAFMRVTSPQQRSRAVPGLLTLKEAAQSAPGKDSGGRTAGNAIADATSMSKISMSQVSLTRGSTPQPHERPNREVHSPSMFRSRTSSSIEVRESAASLS